MAVPKASMYIILSAPGSLNYLYNLHDISVVLFPLSTGGLKALLQPVRGDGNLCG